MFVVMSECYFTINLDCWYRDDLFLSYWGLSLICAEPTCWERESGMLGTATDAPGVDPPKEKVRLWEALSVVCWLVSWWLTPIRSKSSAEGGTGAELEAGAEGDWTLPNRSVTCWAGPELDKAGWLVENAFQSPNSPFPLDDGAAVKEKERCLVIIKFLCEWNWSVYVQ